MTRLKQIQKQLAQEMNKHFDGYVLSHVSAPVSGSFGSARAERAVSVRPFEVLPILLVLILMCLSVQFSFAEELSLSEVQTKGRELAFERKKGNCLACHQMEGGTLAGTVGPPLIQMQARFPDRAVLREQIVDARIRNKNTVMPPFGAHGILSDQELDALIEFLYAL